jgi:hypothetical protein
MEQLITLWCSESVVGIKRAKKEREDKNSLNAKNKKTTQILFQHLKEVRHFSSHMGRGREEELAE